MTENLNEGVTTETETESEFDPALAAIREIYAQRQQERALVAAKLASIDKSLRRLKAAEKSLVSVSPDERPRETNVDKARKIILERGTITQAELTGLLGTPKNTARHALERLTAEGIIVRTGKLVDRSPEFAVANGSR